MLKSYKRHYTLCADTDRNENKFRADPASESHPHIISNEYQVIETEYKLLCCCISEMSDGSNTVDSDFKKGQFGSRLSGSGCNWEIEIKRGRHPLQYVREYWWPNVGGEQCNSTYYFKGRDVKIQRKISTLTKVDLTSSQRKSSGNLATKVILRKITIPQFNGVFLKWQTFADNFKKIIIMVYQGQRIWDSR